MLIVNVWLEHPVINLNKTFSYYANDNLNIKRGIRVMVSLNGKKVVGFVDSVQYTPLSLESYSQQVGYTIKPIDEVIDQEPILNDELYNLGLWLAHNTISPTISCFQTMLPIKMKPKSNRQAVVQDYYVKWTGITPATKSAKQLKAIETLKKAPMLRSHFNKQFPNVYGTLLKKQVIEVFTKEKEAFYDELDISAPEYVLTTEQSQAIQKINASNKSVILLHGLTGTGKTEIYMQLAEQTLRAGKQALILVPEISLTPQMVDRMTTRFGHNIAIYHSGLNEQRKYEQYQLVKNHKVKIVVGTRSAVFMPFSNLGLIVLDEEHDHSYKQDNVPKYHARDIAIHRGEYHNCKVVLGSATPALESYARALKGNYELVELKHRIYQKGLPTSHLINMEKETRLGNYIISNEMTNAIKQRLDNHQQSILLLNRRGYTTTMKCRECGYIVKCPHCDIAMSYHKDTNRLMCHTCGYTQSTNIPCPKCHKQNWNNYGLGTQKLSETIQAKFPEATVLRMDFDTTRKKNGHQLILDAFGKHEGDILLGTQMIAKGLDYPDVTMVGIFNADALLGRTDYRSVEQTFDLIVQASGRSGRGRQNGEVYVQAYDCNHYGITQAVKQDYLAFFKQEMAYRHLGNYPPYCYMISIGLNSKDEQLVLDKASSTADFFREFSDIKTLGPAELIKLYDEYRQRIVLKGTDKDKLIQYVWQWYNEQSFNKQKLKIHVDVDPYVLD